MISSVPRFDMTQKHQQVVMESKEDQVSITKTKNHSSDVIMVATGPGVGPFYDFLEKLFTSETIEFDGTAWLLFGLLSTTTVGEFLKYQEEFDLMEEAFGADDRFRVNYAGGRELMMGVECNVQDTFSENVEEIFDFIENGATIYFCGLESMMESINYRMEEESRTRGLDWNEKLKEWMANEQWNVEVF